MPTFTAIALDRLIEPGGGSRSMAKPVIPKNVSESKPVQNSRLERRNSASTAVNPTTTENKYHWTQISPSLYATPVPTPLPDSLPDSPSSFPPSPYIINHKRRGPRLLKSFSEDDVSLRKKAMEEEIANENLADAETEVAVNDVITVSESCKVEQLNGVHVEGVGSSEMVNGIPKENESPVSFSFNSDGESRFYDPRGSVSFSSNTDGEDNGDMEHSFKLTTPNTEFYDAWEELSSDGTPHSVRDIDSELREIRLSLLTEIEKRKQAEDSLMNMRSQWQRIKEHLSLVGLTLPADPTAVADEQSNCDAAKDLYMQVYAARYVAESIGRGIAKAEVEMEMESQIDAKNFEIARLCDRLHYYESVNREMSQRNQEGVEIARRGRQRRKKRQRWVWGSIAAAITLGTAGLAWSYLPSRTVGLSASNHPQVSEK